LHEPALRNDPSRDTVCGDVLSAFFGPMRMGLLMNTPRGQLYTSLRMESISRVRQKK